MLAPAKAAETLALVAAHRKCRERSTLIVDTDKLAGDAAYREDMRHRFITDHFFAAELLGFPDFSVRAHGPAVQLYGGKNPKLAIRDQPRKRKLLHLDPRHTFKTTLKRVNRVMWIAAFPEEITILNQSATQPLALAVSQKTALAFYRPKGAAAKPLHLIFPELVVDRYPEPVWNTPNRRQSGAGDLDSTLAFTSPQSTQSGWHPMILDNDDVEDTKNSGIDASPDVREGVINTCDQNENLVRDGGFVDNGGTRYHPFDYYGKCLERAKNNPETWDVLVRCSVVVKDGKRLLPGEFPEEDDLELQFPEFRNLSYLELREKFYANYESFMCQQQNDPQGGHVARFEGKLYDGCQIAPERIPLGGDVYMVWRPRYGGKPSMAKYSEGAVAKVLDGRIYVLDAWQGTYTPSGEAEKIVFQAKHHEVDGLMIICVPGSEYVMSHVRNEAARKNRSMRMQWLDFDDDDNRRTGEAEQLEPLMKVGRIWFSTGMTKAQECRNQFVHFGLIEQNGIVEAIAKFADLVPMSQMRANMSEEEIEWQRRRRDDALLSSFLGQQGMNVVDENLRQKADATLNAMAAVSNYNLPSLPGGLDG
jgi:hypothetical protein